jgi:MFS family permease
VAEAPKPPGDPPTTARARLPGDVWALGFVSLLMDVSSEMIHALLPVSLVVVLGTSTLAVGFIEGIAEATAAITKVFSGALSDRLGARKLLAATGYGIAALTKPVFPLVMNIVYALSAYPAGVLSDRMDRGRLLALGLVVLIAADFVLAFAGEVAAVAVGIVLWGLHMGLTPGLLATLVADTAPAVLRGTAFGMFNLVSGVAMLLASVIAGALWDLIGAEATFLAGAGFAMVAALGLLRLRGRFGIAKTPVQAP